MKISKLNFKYLYPQITKTLSESQYISIDFEFSGTNSRKELVNTRYDDANLRYFKLKENIKNFVPLQVGLTGIKIDQNNNLPKINLYPMNFFIFPFLPENSDKKLHFDIGSLDFLTSNSFDFNKTFYDGVRFISLYEYEMNKRDKKVKEIIRSKREDKFYPPEARMLTMSFYPALKTLVEKFINNNFDYSHTDNYLELEITFVRKILLDYFLSNMNNLFKLNEKNLIFEVEFEEKNLLKSVLKIKITNEKLLEEKISKLSKEKDMKKISAWMYYQSIVMNESEEDFVAEAWNKLLFNIKEIIKKKEDVNLNPEEAKDILTGKTDSNSQLIKIISRTISSLNNLDEYNKIGFTKVVTDLIKFNKPLLFHNGILDLMHLVDKFIQPIPETFDEFKKIVNKFFPVIYDTKYLLENNVSLYSIFKDTSLESVSKKLIVEKMMPLKSEDVELQIGDDSDWYSSEYKLDHAETEVVTNMRSHEAGYDSLTTAFVFIYIFKFLFKNVSFLINPAYTESCLRIFKNKLLFSSLQIACDLNIDRSVNNSPSTGRFEIFVITDLPEVITPDEIKNNFTSQFKGHKPHIYKLFGQNLAYLIFTNTNQKEEFLKITNLNSDYPINNNIVFPFHLQGYNKPSIIIPYCKFIETLKFSSEENLARIMIELNKEDLNT